MSAPTTGLKRALSDRGWAYAVAAVTMLITLFPYLIGASFAGDRRYMWLGYNLDDSCVYLSWMRQAADGSFHGLDLFTTESQHGMALNPLFLVLGKIAGVTGLPPLLIYHLARLVFGFVLLAVVWEFIAFCTADPRARRFALLFVCFSSGLGWIPGLWLKTIDCWQPEAITFLSLYLSPLFCFSMALQVGIVVLLLQGERTGKVRYVLAAGLCGFMLGMSHTYDTITMAAIWGGYMTVAVVVRNVTTDLGRLWRHGLIAGAMTAPAVLYIYHALQADSVFYSRMEVKTPSAEWWLLLLGFGLPFAFMLLSVYQLFIRRPPGGSITLQTIKSADGTVSEDGIPSTSAVYATVPRQAAILLVVWMVANIAVSYLPLKQFPFQRKMLQGAHFPIAILAGIAAADIFSRVKVLQSRYGRMAATWSLVGAVCITNVLFMLRDIENDEYNSVQTGMHRPYLNVGEIEALDWIRANTPSDAAIQPLPWVAFSGTRSIGTADVTLACFTPGLIRRAVYCGHWGETPLYPSKLNELLNFALPTQTDQQRIALLRTMKVKYLVFSQKAAADEGADRLAPMFRGLVPLPSYLTLIHSNSDADVYLVNIP